MFLGHIGIGFVAKWFLPTLPLWFLIMNSMLLDLLFFVFMKLGIESIGGDITWSHSFSMAIVWSILASLFTYIIYKNIGSGLIVGLLVFSHWILDYISWNTPMPLFSAPNHQSWD